MISTSLGDNSGFQVAHNNGRIYQEIHLPPERPETSPRPLSTVPFPRSRDFVRRPMQLDWIHQKISEPGCRIAVVGCGGVGKSQLAIECSYQIRDELPQTWVFWIHASDEAHCKKSFQDLATRIKIPGRQDPKANIFELVENWLLDENNGKWICILDNTDDDKLFTSLLGAEGPVSTYATSNAPTKPLLQYIPQIEHGSTIITSRSKEVAMKIVHYKDILEVGPMEHMEAVELFERQLGLPQTDPKVHQLVEALEFMPLAIVQAASYI